MKDNKLKKYQAKRNFKKTQEPSGDNSNNKIQSQNNPLFVIQKHDATRLHYDFRLEIDGVLKSWAVPKGPSTSPQDKRLAIETEDHPLEYANFEGVIPKDNYGAGPVIIWDTGTFINSYYKDNKLISLKDSYNLGHIVVDLEGEKLKGKYALIKTHSLDTSKDKNNWLLIKVNDEHAYKPKDPIANYPKSVKSSKTIEQVKKDTKNKDDL